MTLLPPTPPLPPHEPRRYRDPDEPDFPGFLSPYPHLPPEFELPGRPPRPTVYPPVPAVWMPADDPRAQVYEQLLSRRIVFVERALDAETASLVAAQLMTLDADADAGSGGGAGTGTGAGDDADADVTSLQPVTLVVNSPGGPLDAAATVLDTVDLMRCPVDTTCIGQATGTAAVVVAAGTGARRAGRSAQFRLRFPEVDLTGSATQLRDQVVEVRRLHDLLIDRLVAVTGQERRLVVHDLERGRALSAEEAVAYGLVDEVVERPR
jgi:ATP-dependent Clp protease protease subunit